MLLQMMVPESLIADLNPLHLMYGDLWKQVIWYSRRGAYYPADLRRFLEEQGLIIGNIAHNHNRYFSRIRNWKDITERSVLRLEDSRPAIQVVPMKAPVEELVADHCKDKVWLYVYGPRLIPVSKP